VTDLVAIVRATRKSALAVDRIARAGNAVRRAQGAAEQAQASKALDRALADFNRAQAVLRANPLPGDAR